MHTGIPWRNCGFGSKPQQKSEYHERANHTRFVISQCICKLCLHSVVDYHMCIMSKKVMYIH